MKKHVLLLGGVLSTLINVNAQTVLPVAMGRASNAYSAVTTEQNQVYANDANDQVVFIHRQDVSVWGGGGNASGKLRYDISTDGGATFSNDIGY